MKCAVLISLYNAEKTLDKTFESLSVQTFQDFRIIAINDCSKDDTLNSLKKWQNRFGEERFFLLANETNIGLTRSLNKGLSFITEPYTARIDADDKWHPEKLEKQIYFLENHPDCDLVGTWYENISSKGLKRITLPETNEEIKRNIFKHNPFAHSCVVFRTNKIKEVEGYDETVYYGQDYDLWLRLLPQSSFANIPEFLCFRNIENTLTSDGKNQKDQMLQCVKTRIKYLRRYKRSLCEYKWLAEPILVAIAPQWLKKLKRKATL
jgi:glycosyltransferase involved in cell wall biosynthesis